MTARYEGKCKYRGVVASARDRNEWARAPSTSVLLWTTRLARRA